MAEKKEPAQPPKKRIGLAEKQVEESIVKQAPKPAKKSGELVKVKFIKSCGRHKARTIVTLDSVEAGYVVEKGVAKFFKSDKEMSVEDAVKLIDEYGGEISVVNAATTKGSVLAKALEDSGLGAGELADKIEELEKQLEDAKKPKESNSNGSKSK